MVGVDANLVGSLRVSAWLSKVSYSVGHGEEIVTKKLSSADFSSVSVLDHDRAQGIVCSKEGVSYVVFTGTDSIKKLITDAYVLKRPIVKGHEAEAHGGFHSTMGLRNNQSVSFYDAIQEAIPKGNRVVVCGHSLGAGMKDVYLSLGIRYGWADRVIGAHGFGQPRSGNVALAKMLDQHYEDRLIRVENDGDPVPKVPYEFMGYMHAGWTLTLNDDQTFSVGEPPSHSHQEPLPRAKNADFTLESQSVNNEGQETRQRELTEALTASGIQEKDLDMQAIARTAQNPAAYEAHMEMLGHSVTDEPNESLPKGDIFSEGFHSAGFNLFGVSQHSIKAYEERLEVLEKHPDIQQAETQPKAAQDTDVQATRTAIKINPSADTQPLFDSSNNPPAPQPRPSSWSR